MRDRYAWDKSDEVSEGSLNEASFVVYEDAAEPHNLLIRPYDGCSLLERSEPPEP